MKISRFLDTTPPWENEDPGVRRQAVLERDLEPAILNELARQDPDEGVRAAAISRSGDLTFLTELLTGTSGAPQAHAARRWAELAAELPRDRQEQDLDAFTETVRLQIAIHAPGVDQRALAAERLSETPLLMAALREPNHSRVHQVCARQLEDETSLEEIKRQFQGRDKGVYQITRDKLAAIRSSREQTRTFEARCADTCEALEALLKADEDPTFARRLDVLTREWQELAADGREFPAGLRDRAETAIATAQARLEQAQAERRARDEAVEGVLSRLEALRDQLASGEALDTIETALGAIRADWPEGLADKDPRRGRYEKLTALAERSLRAWHECQSMNVDEADAAQLERFLKQSNWPSEFTAPATISAARQKLDALKAADEQASRDREQLLTTTRNQLTELERKIDDGNLKGGRRGHSSLAEKLQELGTELPADVHDNFARLSGRLKELNDWHRFVTLPKREALCESMESLATDEAMPPPEKASAIKDLQESWKSLGPSDDRASQQLWSRFRQAADKAYAPCAAWFEAQKQQRQANLAQRQAICEELETFNASHDWTHPDYKAAATLIGQSLRAWREAGEVPRTKFRKVSDRFSAALKPIQDRLDAERERNRREKSAIIDKVAGYATDDSTPLPDLIEKTKQAQQEWQSVGITDRKADQKLWKAFRRECDRVFARRDEERKTAKNEADEARQRCEQVISSLKQAADSDDFTRGQLRQLRSDYDNVARQAGKGAPHKAFRAALKHAEKALERQVLEDKCRELDEIRRRAHLCRQLESGAASAGQVEAEWEGDIDLDVDIANRLEARRSAAVSGEADPAANAEAAALLCVRAEILAGLESPAEAGPLRMQYQVERLNRELSQGQKDQRSPDEQFRDLQNDWYTLGPLPAGTDDLERRFTAAETVFSRQPR